MFSKSSRHGFAARVGLRAAARVVTPLAAVVAVLSGLAFPTRGSAQVTFTSSATASYNLQGRTIQSGFPEAVYSDIKTLSTNNPFAEPVQFSTSIGGTLGSGGASATLATNATAQQKEKGSGMLCLNPWKSKEIRRHHGEIPRETPLRAPTGVDQN